MKENLKQLWGRAGVTFYVTDEEAAVILDHKADGRDIARIMRKIVDENRFALEGNSYIPSISVTDFNKENGTEYDDDGEPEWDF